MLYTIKQIMQNVSAGRDREAIQRPMGHIANRLNGLMLNTAGLVIKTGGSTLAKTGSSDAYVTVGGALVKIAASTDMPALTGITITATKFNVVCFFIDNAGTVTAAPGVEGAAIGTVKWPDFPLDKVLVGALLITYASTFTGGTTALDTATTVYLSPTGPVDPTLLYS